MFNPWMVLGLRAFQLGFEAQNVIALRMMRLASADAGSRAEFMRMIVEKGAAVAEAQLAAAFALMNGDKDHVAATKALLVFRRRVRANRRRLSPGHPRSARRSAGDK